MRSASLRAHGLGDVLEREDLPALLLAEPDAAAGADAEPRTDAEAEPTADPGHVEDDQQREDERG